MVFNIFSHKKDFMLWILTDGLERKTDKVIIRMWNNSDQIHDVISDSV